MSEPGNPFDVLLEAFRQVVREEIRAAQNSSTNGHGAGSELLTVAEIAKALKVPSSWIYDRTRRKRDPIPHIKVGRYPRFQLERVLGWLQSNKKD
jgi:excisionase family DNA binding protein